MFKNPFALMVKTVPSANHSRSWSATRRRVKWFDIIEMITHKYFTSQLFKPFLTFNDIRKMHFYTMNGKIIWIWQNELLPKRYTKRYSIFLTGKASIAIRFLTIWVELWQNICSAASLQEMVHFVKENSFCIWNFFQLNSLLFITCSFGGGVST